MYLCVCVCVCVFVFYSSCRMSLVRGSSRQRANGLFSSLERGPAVPVYRGGLPLSGMSVSPFNSKIKLSLSLSLSLRMGSD